MPASPLSPQTAPVSRRTVVKASAWALPVVVVAVGAPLASASTTGVDLRLLGPQFGSSAPMFTPSLTQRYFATEPVGTVVGNGGDTAFGPGPITVILDIDSRIWDITGFTFTPAGGTETTASFTGPVATGNRLRYTVTFAAAIAAGADEYSGVLVRPRYSFLGEYPNDTVPVEDSGFTWTLVPPAGDASATNDVWAIPPATPVDSAPFGLGVQAEFEQVGTGSAAPYRPTSVTATSIGPNATLASDQLYVGFANAAGSAVAPTNVRLNGTPTSGLLTVAQNSLSGDYRTVFLEIGTPLAESDVLEFDLTYTENPSAGTPSRPNAQVSFWPATRLNSPDQRRGPSANMPAI